VVGTEPGRAQPSHQGLHTIEELFSEITRLTEANRACRSLEVERRILQLRHLAGKRLAETCEGVPQYAAPSREGLPDTDGLPGFGLHDVTPGRLRAAILRDGCMIVRGLVERDLALGLAARVEHAFDEREQKDSGAEWDSQYYEEFQPEGPFRSPLRPWIKKGGGLLAVDSPRLAFELTEIFEGAGVPRLVAQYLGEPVVLSVDKTTFRKVEPTVTGAWHQDGSFMGQVRSLNLWLSLSYCGDDAPGLDIVPRRLNRLMPTGTEGTFLADQVSQATAEEAADGLDIVRPIFEPGDAVLFDELCLHQTGSDASMGKTRYAIESWFFGCSAFPESYAPLAVVGGQNTDDG
jgi:hypothetical protein